MFVGLVKMVVALAKIIKGLVINIMGNDRRIEDPIRNRRRIEDLPRNRRRIEDNYRSFEDIVGLVRVIGID